MRKGLKKKISLILVMAMVMGMSMPVSAKENRSAFDETIFTEEPGSDSTVIEEELSPDGPEALGSGDIDTESDAVESDANGGSTQSLPDGWAIYLSDGSTPAGPDTDYTYTYSSTGGTVTIIKNVNTAEGLEIAVRSHSAGAIPTLTWDSNTNSTNPVPVTLKANCVAAIDVIAPEGAVGKKIIKADRSTYVAKQIQETEYQYTDNDRDISEPSGSYRVYISEAGVSGLSTDDVTIGNSISGKPTLNFDQNCGQVIAAAISSSDVGPNSRIYRNNDAWHATGWGNSLIIFSSNNSLSMKTLRYEARELNVDNDKKPQETLSVNPSDTFSISGTISNMKSASRYQIAAFTADREIVANSSSEIDTSESGSSANFTINGLTANTSYRVGARVIDSTSSYGYKYSNTLYIPSDWIYSDSVTLHSATYNITYDGLSGSSFENYNPNPSTYTVEGDSIILQNPTKPGYEFKGWYAGTASAYEADQNRETNIVVKINPATAVQTGNLTYTAIFEELSYNIEYDLAGGTFGEKHPTAYIPSAGLKRENVTDPTKTGYEFAGWKLGTAERPVDSTADYLIAVGSTGDKTLTATWTEKELTVTIDLCDTSATLPEGSSDWTTAEGGTAKFIKSFNINSASFSLPTPSLANREFTGWETEQNGAKSLLVTIPKGTTKSPKKIYSATWATKALEGTITISASNDGRGYVYGQTLTAAVKDADGNSISEGVTYAWYKVGYNTSVGSDATYTVKDSDIGTNIYCVVSVAGTSGSIKSASTPVIGKRPLRIEGGTVESAGKREYVPGKKSVNITAITFAEGDVISGDSITNVSITGELADEYAGENKPVTVDLSKVNLEGNATKYELQLEEDVAFTSTIEAATAPLTTSELLVQYGGTLTKEELEAAVSGALGRTLSFVIPTQESPGEIDSGYNYHAPSKDAAGGANQATVVVQAQEKSAGGDTAPEYKADTKNITIHFSEEGLITQTLAWNSEEATSAGLTENAVSKAVGSEFTISATNVTSDNGAKGVISYSSNDESVASVDATGKVTVKKKGTAVITATAAAVTNKSKAGSISYTVTGTVTEIETLPPIAIFNRVYTGNEITLFTIPENAGYKFAEGSNATNTSIGKYTSIIELKPGYEWKVGSIFYDETENQITIAENNKTYPITLKWEITKERNNATLSSDNFKISNATPGLNNGSIKYIGSTLDAVIEYAVADDITGDPEDSKWITARRLEENKTIDGLASGTYKLRIKATDTVDASASLTLRIGTGYKVTFVTSIGTAPDSQITVNGKATKPTDPVDSEGTYTFQGWFTTPDGNASTSDQAWNFGNDSFTGDKTLYARWSGKTIGFTYNLDDGELPANYPTGYTVGGDMVKIVNPTRSGYLFTGWTASGDLVINNDQTNVTVDPATLTTHNGITFTAHWKERLAVPMAILREKQGSELVPLEGTTFDADTAYVLLDILNSDAEKLQTWAIYYTIGDTMPTMDSQTFTKEFAITDTTKINAFVVDPSGTYADSEIVTYTFTKYSSTPVSTPITGIKVSPEAISVDKDKTATLTASFLPAYANENATITWTSSDTSIATVSESGTSATVTGVKTGTATITASVMAKGGTFTATCEVTVEENVEITGITVAPATATLVKTKSLNLTAALVPVDTTEQATITWTSSDTSIATVSESGTSATVTGIKVGTATITASVTNRGGKTFSNEAKINVIDDILYNPKVSWTVKFPNSFTKGSAAPELQYTVTYTFANTGETKTSDPIKVTATSTNNFFAGSTDKEVTFTAVADLTGYFEDKEGTRPAKNVELSRTYRFKEGSDDSKSNSGSESGQSVSEPEGSATYNLFYTDTEIRIPLPEGVDTTKADSNAKWAKFYKVESDGTVTVTGDRKKAASAKNSLIVLPVFDGETQVGQFSYQLSTSYVKPKLSLSSNKADIKKGEEQTVTTTVLEKKSNGLSEAIDVTNQAEGVSYWNGSKGSVTVAEGDEAGQLLLTTTDAASGKIVIQQENWNEKIELKYTIKAKNEDVLSASAKTVTMNSNATAGDEQTVTILLNNNEIDSESDVSVTMPKGWESANIEVEGIEEGKLVSSELKFGYKEGAPKKGNYTFKFTKGKAKVSVKLAVSNAALTDKAVTLKVKTELDLVTGQKMVVQPVLKGVSGQISNVALDETNAELFDIEYNDELNQIYISAKDISKLNTKTTYAFNVSMTVGGVECKTVLKTKLSAKKPTVNIAALTLPKANVAKADAAASLISTYKLGGKTFSIAPSEVKFMNGTAVEGEDGWFIDSKTNAKVHYDAENGKIEVKANDAEGAAAIKKGSVNIEIHFAGLEKPVKKTLSIKVK